MLLSAVPTCCLHTVSKLELECTGPHVHEVLDSFHSLYPAWLKGVLWFVGRVCFKGSLDYSVALTAQPGRSAHLNRFTSGCRWSPLPYPPPR